VDLKQLKKEIEQKDGSYSVTHSHIKWMLEEIETKTNWAEYLSNQIKQLKQEIKQLKSIK